MTLISLLGKYILLMVQVFKWPLKGKVFWGQLMNEFQKLGLDYRIAMESSNIELSSVYVEMGLGVSLGTVIKDLPALSRRQLEFLPLGHLFKPDHIALVMRRGKVMASYKTAFMKALIGEGSAAG